MTTRTGAIALVLSAAALGLAAFSLTREEPQPERASMRMDRVAVLERRVEDLAREIEGLRTGWTPRGAPAPSGAEDSAAAVEPGTPGTADEPRAAVTQESDLESMVDVAVDRKTKAVLDELRVKADKKPALSVLADVLELDDHQRARVERVVVEGQRQVYGILETPTANGTNLMGELVEIAARGIAEPGKDHGWFKWIARVASEKIPGTDQTYAARIEAVKQSMRDSFRREWSDAQYKEFVEWGVDPTEISKIADSPQAALIERIKTRARQLGAQIPDDES